MTTTGWILLFVFARLIDLVIWYFLNRGSVRANEEPEKDYLEEARKKAGLI